MMLHTKYQGSRPYGFRQEYFFQIFPYISICKQCDPGVGPFLAQGHNLNKPGRGPLGSRPYCFKQEDFPCFSLYKPL